MTPRRVQVVRFEPSDKWTHALLDGVFDESLWSFPDARYDVVKVEEAVETRWLPTVVVVPGEEWAGRVDEVNHYLEQFSTVLVAVVADEGSLFPWEVLEHPNMRLWIQTPRPGVHPPGAARYFGFGWKADTPTLIREISEVAPGTWPDLEWFFAGQVTHPRRLALVEVLRRMAGGLLLETKSFGAGYKRGQYLLNMLRAKWLPCPSGPVCVDSFRFYEALEAGRLPILDGECPGYPPEHNGWDYWRLVYGDAFPFPILHDWSDLERYRFGGLLPVLTSAWWQATKRDLAWDLRCDALRLSRDLPIDGITAVVTMSPIPSHPSLEILEETIRSIRERLPDVDIIVAADGTNPNAPVEDDAYLHALERLVWLCEHEWTGVLPIVSERWVHQANMLRRALDHVRTTAVLFLEHDTPLCGDPIPWDPMLQSIHVGAANLIRFSSEASILEPWRHLYLEPDHTLDLYGVPMLRTVQWSSRPYLADVQWHREILETYFAPESRTYTEDVLHGVVQAAFKRRGEAGWREWRMWTYAPAGDMKRSTHTDGRAGAPKGDDRLVFAYPGGGTPPGAPRATADR